MILGREKELALLKKVLHSKKAEFLAIYGRRRVGKTFLIREFCKDKGLYLEITGSNKASPKDQLRNFYRELTNLFPQEPQSKPPKDWSEAFELVLQILDKLDPAIKFILFLDELPWLASRKSGLLAALDYFWNRHFSRFPNMLLIICGSAAHWIIRKIINDKGGLYGRLTAQMRLQPFTLRETEIFLQEQKVHLDRKQLTELYMAFGGIAKYLTEIPSGKSAAQIINNLCFSPTGFLFSEFSRLYESLFDVSEKHIAIVHALAKKRYGMHQDELLRTLDLPSSGRSSTILQELEECGFIMNLPAFGKKTKEKQWRLIDEYSLFYLQWIEPIKSSVLRNFDKEYWNKQYQTPTWHAWAGYAFENICLKHSGKIKEALGIGSVTTQESHWQYRPSKNAKENGAEIDLVIDRADSCINLCEMKFCNTEFEVTKSYAENLRKKKESFQKVTGTKKTLFLTLITPYGTKENEHYLGLIDQQLTLDALF